MGSGWQRPREEVEGALQAQVGFLRSSAASYDAGNVLEAARIAAALFVLLHDGRQQSILSQLGQRRHLRFPTPVYKVDVNNLAGDSRLTSFRVYHGQPFKFVPKCWSSVMEPMEFIQFPRWWDQEAIFRTPLGETITRKRLLASLRDQDGGGHLDPRLTDATYVGLSRHNSLGWSTSGPNSKSAPISPAPHLVAARHIAWEVDTAMIDSGVTEGKHPLPADSAFSDEKLGRVRRFQTSHSITK